MSGLVHLPYLWLLALAYTHGDFGVSYPLARGGGAALAALLGVALLGDHLTTGEVVGVVVIVGGLGLLSWGATARNAGLALGVAATIGAYTTIDAQGARLERIGVRPGDVHRDRDHDVDRRRGDRTGRVRSPWSSGASGVVPC